MRQRHPARPVGPLRALDTTVTKASAWAQQQRKPAAVRELLGLTGQFAAVDELLTGRENLEMFGRLFKLSSEEARRRAGELLERFDLAQAADRPARTYSGGMRRRLDIASSLLHHAGLAADVRENQPRHGHRRRRPLARTLWHPGVAGSSSGMDRRPAGRVHPAVRMAVPADELRRVPLPRLAARSRAMAMQNI